MYKCKYIYLDMGVRVNDAHTLLLNCSKIAFLKARGVLHDRNTVIATTQHGVSVTHIQQIHFIVIFEHLRLNQCSPMLSRDLPMLILHVRSI